ncbi:hypothetical protein AX17_000538 [Amanita inopinata Kibby_2008]|nr:hypothetical protein AX17_000538 [Amanita inopinata Kibby_2008]
MPSMWWLDPGKELLNLLFNRILAPYVENLDLNQVNYGIGQGQLTLRNLRLKKGALDKFQLPVDVAEGHLGRFTLALHWRNLGNQPVEVLVEDVYLLVVPSSQSDLDPAEEEARLQAAKAERLENAELLHMRGQIETSPEEFNQSQGLWQSLVTKIINNIQITIKNIHIRYEDKKSVPGHPFASGVTLAEFTAVSVDDQWQPVFIESTAGAVHKLAKLSFLALYFDTDSSPMAGLSSAETDRILSTMAGAIFIISQISHGQDGQTHHQFILKPVTGEGRVIINHKFDLTTPRYDVQLIFDEIGVALDNHQYRDVISLVDMYHVYLRQHQYRRFRPADNEYAENPARARLRFACIAILEEIREHRKKWTWAYFAERRDDRNKYVTLFQGKLLNSLVGTDLDELETLEKKLSYEDLRFYRSIARSRLRKDQALQKKLELERNRQRQKQSWTSWLWGSVAGETDTTHDESTFGGRMTDEQRRQLYQVLDYDEKKVLADSFQAPRDSLKARISARLNRGSISLVDDPHGRATNIMSIVFDLFQAKIIQRPDNFEASVSLECLSVFDGTTKQSLYPQIVQVKRDMHVQTGVLEPKMTITNTDVNPEAFFYLMFEHTPLDERADNALTVRMRHMEIIYHKGYIEAIYKFFKPPASQLESVEALLSVAGHTLEGIRKETRTGLEYALQMHKTIDIQMDLNAPVIIIPEDVTTNFCKHLIIDAGHIAVESKLADKKEIRSIQQKRQQSYSEEDYRSLESLMYDKFMLRLEAAQFIIGDNLKACQDALSSGSKDSLHLLERINIDLQIQNSIVPTVLSLARFKISGRLPLLKVNFSDSKYKALMRLVDVCIPNFGENRRGDVESPPPRVKNVTGGFPLTSSLFGLPDLEYHTDEEQSDSEEAKEDEGTVMRLDLHQHIMEIDFCADTLSASIAKTDSSSVEIPLGDVVLQRFALRYSVAKFDMKVNVNLRSLSMTLVQPGNRAINFVTSTESDTTEDKDLLSIKYRKVQQESPEFLDVFEGIEQQVDVNISTFILKASPEPLLSVYDFIMITFVPEGTVSDSTDPSASTADDPTMTHAITTDNITSGKIRIKVQLASVKVSLIHESTSLATLSLSTADVAILLHSDMMQVTGRLGDMSLVNDDDTCVLRPEFQQILSIEGQNLAEFSYQTLGSSRSSSQEAKSVVTLNAASLKLHYLEGPLRGIYVFFMQFAKLKGLYDTATQVAAQRAPEIGRMEFNISIKSPIVVFPSDPGRSPDVLVLRLGEVTAKNTIKNATSNVTASLQGIQFVSELYSDGNIAVLKIIDDIDITSSVVQLGPIDRTEDIDRPDTQVIIKVSDVRLHLTQTQYRLLVDLTRSIPRVFVKSTDIEGGPADAPIDPDPMNALDTASVSLRPELKVPTGQHTWTSMDLIVSVNGVKLHLYDSQALSDRSLKDHGIVRFALHDNTLRLKTLTNGSLEAQVTLRSFTITNTRPGSSRFREIIPAAQHSRNQFMILYVTSGEIGGSALAVLTIDSPKIIFAIDPMVSLLEFLTSTFPTTSATHEVRYQPNTSSPGISESSRSAVDYRIDLHDTSISILENDADPESQALQMSVNQVLLSQQSILALEVDQLGMSLTRMGRPSENVRFLDDVNLTLSMDSRSSTSGQMTNIEIFCKSVIFRASYRDIMLITSIVNKAMNLYDKSQNSRGMQQDVLTLTPRRNMKNKRSASEQASPAGKARLKCSIDGFSLVLIGDLYEQPLIYLQAKPFIVGAQDWSGELRATTTIANHISYWNLTNSHWEPLIDPWTFTLSISKDGVCGGLSYSLLSRERLDLNITATFIDTVVTTVKVWNKEGTRVLQKARGVYAPYRIRNCTGTAVYIWSDASGSTEVSSVRLPSEKTIDWRFDDWRTTREHFSSLGQHSIGLRFDGKTWEPLRNIPVDREGEYTFLLRPRTSKYPSRLLCEIRVVDSVKVVTLRSTYKIENNTLYPLELMLVDDQGQPVHSLEKVVPGQDYSLPIDAVTQCRVRLQPDQGFGYRWSSAVCWEDLLAKKSFTITCNHADPKEAPFRIQACVKMDGYDITQRKHPKVNLKLCAPLEIENLLPHNVDYQIYDKNMDQTWMSYLRKGGIMPVHSVELGHLLLLNIIVQDTVFKPSDFAIINIGENSPHEVEDHLNLQDQVGRQLKLKLHYLRHPDAGGAFRVQIYSPYIIVNKTGLPFWVRAVRSVRTGYQDAAGESRAEHLTGPTPFLLSHLHDGHEFMVRFGESTWSKLISVEAPSAEAELVAACQKRKSDDIHIGLSWTEGLGKYKLTKVITLSPRFLLKNNMSDAIIFRQHGEMPRENSILEPRARCPLRLFRADSEKLLTFAYPGLDAQWSSPINIEDIGAVHFRLRSPGTSQIRLVRTDIQINGATIFVAISSSENHWPFKIENESDYIVKICQTSSFDEQSFTDPDPIYVIQRHSVLHYAWDRPAAKEKRILLLIKGYQRVIDMLEIGDLMPFTFYDNQRPKSVSLDVRADGHMQVLRITTYDPDRSLYKPRKRSNVNVLSRSESISSTSDVFEAVPEQVSPTLTYLIDFAGIGISLVDKKLVEVLYITMDSLKFEYADSPVARAINISCGTMQVDNQLHDALFPIVLQPTPVANDSVGVAALPTIQASVIWLNDDEHGVLFIKYCSILLQALTIEAEEDLLFSLYNLSQIEGIWEDGAEDVLIQDSNDTLDPPEAATGQEVYFEVLEFQPIMLSLSFMRTERINSDEQLSNRNPLAVALNALTMTIGNINDAPLEMNALAIKDMRLRIPELKNRVLYHYRQDVLRQLYRILGSADFIGNPVGLFNNVSSGVADIFYEPFHGVVMRGNRELGIGIAKGAASFVKKTVFGVTDSVTKFTSSVSKGLSAATFDSEYQARRRLNQRRNRPRHAIYGVAAGGEAFANSVTSAVEGVVMKPIEGAETEGALGFFKGIGKGLVGVMTKPVIGVFDLASNVSEGIRNTTTVFDNPDKDRVRMPRLIPADGVLRPYSAREALGQYWMKDLNDGAYRREAYVAHINSPGGDNITLLTSMRILSFWPKKLRLAWELPFTEVQGVTVEDTGIRFTHKAGREHDKFVHIPDKTSQSWFFGHIASVVKSFNSKRRMDS